ncbi:MAG: undecaprenyldiphospho-muramoylpentapeptide beta-N-acetylglucosaminyltransferase [Bacillota bacterium]|nr:undecaprenyldiphospho-muramoylpentapeptide beta-N-acetylglucosaminyltransferase [Bacillota bacterium]
MNIILSGGGTGGHIYPALAIASEIRQRMPDVNLLYVGTARGLEKKIVPERGIPFQSIEISGIDRSSISKAGKSIVNIPRSIVQARRIIKAFKPDVIVGTGGYVSYPIVLAGTFLGVKTVIHEQNAMPGLANKHLARRVDHVLLTFEEARAYLASSNIKVTGLPVRKEILQVNQEEARKKLGLRRNCFTLLVFGGSLGARTINEAILALMGLLQKNEEIQIIWVTGDQQYDVCSEQYQQRINQKDTQCYVKMFPYLYNMEDALAVADLAICRAGASTISELAVMGLPAILVPYPYAAENHQEKNAAALVKKNATEMVIDHDLDGDTLFHKIQELREDREKLKILGENILREARPNALEDIVDIVLSNG